MVVVPVFQHRQLVRLDIGDATTRYVDGLGTWAPKPLEIYRTNAAEIVARGYSAVAESATAAVTP